MYSINNLIMNVVNITGNALMLYFIGKILESRPRMLWALLYLASNVVFVNVRDFFGIGSQVNAFLTIVSLSLLFCIPLLYSGKYWHKMVFVVYFTMLFSIIESVFITVISTYYGSIGWTAMYREHRYILIFHAVATSITGLLLGLLSIAIWRKASMRRFQWFYLLVLSVPIGQYLTAFSFLVAGWDYIGLIGIVICLGSSAVMLFYILSFEKREALENELREAKHQLELDYTRFCEVERLSNEMAKIRHELNNQLMTIIQLARRGEDKTAQEMIAALEEEIQYSASSNQF